MLLVIHPVLAFAQVHKVKVFESGQEGYHTYRIPAIIKAANGDLLAFAEGRKNGRGDAGDIDLVMKRSTDKGKTWSALQLVQDEFSDPSGNITIGNPAPVVDNLDPRHPGRIWMPFTRNNRRVFTIYSDDHGATWSPRVEITSTAKDPAWRWYATGPVHAIQLERGPHAGRLIIPSDHGIGSTTHYGAHVVYSDDHGLTWELGAVDTHSAADPVHPNENVAIELVDGRIYFNARDQGGSSIGTRAIAYSSDGGLTFDAPFTADPNIITPVVQNAAMRFAATDRGDAENILIYSNPGQPSSRRDLTIQVSFDEGTTWVKDTLIHPGPAAYSDLVKIDKNTIGTLYEAGASLYQEILFGYFDLDALDPAPWNGIEGDVNQDGSFDEDDLTDFVAVWTPASNVFYTGGENSYSNGDLNFDGVNDLNDVWLMRQALLNTNFPTTRLDQLAQVPESSISCLLAGLVCSACNIRPLFIRGAINR